MSVLPFRFARVLGFASVMSVGVGICADANASPVARNSIENGAEAASCNFPSTVALELEGSETCSGTLIHPRVVLTAAHCIRREGDNARVKAIVFGDRLDSKAFRVTPQKCARHPEYGLGFTRNDWGYCVLETPVTSIPTVPVASGCELEALVSGKRDDIMLAGFGATTPKDSKKDSGTKRFGATKLQKYGRETFYSSDGVGLLQAGPGDSGGAALFQLDDGSWRSIGIIASVTQGAQDTRVTRLATTAARGIQWLEADSGIDVTPCFTGSRWTPSAECGNFLKSAKGEVPGQGSWGETLQESCQESLTIQKSGTCGNPFPAKPEVKEAPPRPTVTWGWPDKESVKVRETHSLAIWFKVEGAAPMQPIEMYLGDAPLSEQIFEYPPYEYRFFRTLKPGNHRLSLKVRDINEKLVEISSRTLVVLERTTEEDSETGGGTGTGTSSGTGSGGETSPDDNTGTGTNATGAPDTNPSGSTGPAAKTAPKAKNPGSKSGGGCQLTTPDSGHFLLAGMLLLLVGTRPRLAKQNGAQVRR